MPTTLAHVQGMLKAQHVDDKDYTEGCVGVRRAPPFGALC
eukprot:gene7942-7957_t